MRIEENKRTKGRRECREHQREKRREEKGSKRDAGEKKRVRPRGRFLMSGVIHREINERENVGNSWQTC